MGGIVNNIGKHEGFSVITCTNKAIFMDRIMKNYSSQRYDKKELIIILNSDRMDLAKWRNKARQYPNVFVYKLPEKRSLGSCLNYAVKKCKHGLIAKFDDDDYYAPNYLKGMYRAFVRSGADIVGKRSFYTFIQRKNLLIERFPGFQNQFVSRVAGATLTFRKKVFDRVRFQDVSLGEDVKFLTSSRKIGYKIYSSNRYNYVCIRRKHRNYHTWQPSDRYLLQKSRIIAKSRNYKNYVNS
jgi:glycosyltransferase involved in cell wall biosynthesis